jgi:pimeloyl-ACP methyl ester carboxylesterase
MTKNREEHDMKNIYGVLDNPEVAAAVFHPRPDLEPPPRNEHVSDHLISVDSDVHIGARFHTYSQTGANLLFFHGNGEIAADYDQLGPLFGKLEMNLLAADYRGYGRSNGRPTVSAMMADCHRILAYVREWLAAQDLSGPMVVMGRSLGSASALELAAEHPDVIKGLIIESGFAYAGPLLRLLGVDLETLGFKEEEGFVNLQKISRYHAPTLIIHAEYDHIIPYADGLALYKASAAQDKQLLKIEDANHNDIMMRGFDSYMQSIDRLVSRVATR